MRLQAVGQSSARDPACVNTLCAQVLPLSLINTFSVPFVLILFYYACQISSEKQKEKDCNSTESRGINFHL